MQSLLRQSIARTFNLLTKPAAAAIAKQTSVGATAAVNRCITYSLKGVAPQIRADELGQAWAAPSADIIGNVVLKSDASVWFKAVIRGDNDTIIIGERSNVQDGAILHTDPGIELVIGDDVTIGHGAVLHGCKVGNGALIGIRSIILNNAEIGEGCIIGAGALIPEGKKIPPNSLVMGVPGKIVREVKPEEREELKRLAGIYVSKARVYASGLVPVRQGINKQ